MLPRAYLTEWSATAPWPDPVQVEQDLILSRMLVEAASDPLLGEALAFRGGTCLQKLYLPSPVRYSEDLDFVRTDPEPRLGDIFDAFRAIAAEIGLREHRWTFPNPNSDMGAIWFDADPTAGPGMIRIKIESNVAETEPYLPFAPRVYGVDSRWWRGRASVLTCDLDDLLGTKLRALYQRRKGRDLFDLWIAFTLLEPDGKKIAAALTHYMRGTVFTYPQLRLNLQEKLSDTVFVSPSRVTPSVLPWSRWRRTWKRNFLLPSSQRSCQARWRCSLASPASSAARRTTQRCSPGDPIVKSSEPRVSASSSVVRSVSPSSSPTR